MRTLKQFIKSEGLKISFVKTDSNPLIGDYYINHYIVTISKGDKSFQINYSMGVALEGKPQLKDVMDCLASDSTALDMSFSEFCKEFGYSDDSRKAEAIYKQCISNAQKLHSLLGSEAFTELVYYVGRE